MSNTNGYGDNSISSLKGAERVRQRPSVLFGTNDLIGAFHTVNEILANSLDEARSGFGDKIYVTYHEDGSISVQDFGRGVPMGWNEAEGRYNWDLIFNELYAGGKYDAESDNWEFPLGLNGLGASGTQYTSEFMEVRSSRDGKHFEKSFKKGIPVDEIEGTYEGYEVAGEVRVYDNPENTTGTYIHWKIDNEVFPKTDFTTSMFRRLLESQAYINSVTIIFKDEIHGVEETYEGSGIEAYLKSKLNGKEKELIYREVRDQGTSDGQKYRAKAEIILAITDEFSSTQMHYHNASEMSGGVHVSAFHNAVTTFFNKIGREQGLKIEPYDYQDYISILTSTYSSYTSFAHQTKSSVSNDFIYNLIYDNVYDILDEAYAMQKESVYELITNVINVANARRLAKEFEQQQRLVKSAVQSSKRKIAEKLKECASNKPEECELYIVEGDSAGGSVSGARYSQFQAVLPLKGKPINALKAPLEKLLENQVVKDIISTLECGIDPDGSGDMFDISKLRFHKIIIATDADVDGSQIRVLIYSIFKRLFPQLLEGGYVYVLETPLFEISSNKDSYFAYTLAERDIILKELSEQGKVVTAVKRSKGLGSNNKIKMRQVATNPETRKMVKLEIDPHNEIVNQITDMLFGQDIQRERKDFIISLIKDSIEKDLTIDKVEVEVEEEELA